MTDSVDDLLILQELDAMIRDFENPSIRMHEEGMGFGLRATTELHRERSEVVKKLSPEAVFRYDLARRRHVQPVAPSRDGVCLGCHTVRPTAMSSRAERLDVCERCGRLLFRVETQRTPRDDG
jgi:hypothetical protein